MDKKPIPAIPHPVAITMGGHPYIYNAGPDVTKLLRQITHLQAENALLKAEKKNFTDVKWVNRLLSKFNLALVRL
jgi:hypothetical protein